MPGRGMPGRGMPGQLVGPMLNGAERLPRRPQVRFP